MTAGGVDWRTIRVHEGDWTCPVHGVIDPGDDGLVPYCPHLVAGRRCMRLAMRAELRRGKVVHVEPRPRTCQRGHPLGPNTVLLGWDGCQCTPAGGHRSWSCRTCRDVQTWPPHLG